MNMKRNLGALLLVPALILGVSGVANADNNMRAGSMHQFSTCIAKKAISTFQIQVKGRWTSTSSSAGGNNGMCNPVTQLTSVFMVRLPAKAGTYNYRILEKNRGVTRIIENGAFAVTP